LGTSKKPPQFVGALLQIFGADFLEIDSHGRKIIRTDAVPRLAH